MRFACLIALAIAIPAAPALAQLGEGGGPQVRPGAMSMRTVPPTPRTFSRGDQVLPGFPGFPEVNDYDGDGKVDRPCKGRRCWRGYGLYLGYGGWPEGRRGYFADAGEVLGVSGGRVDYDYDRGYPYDHYSRGSEPAYAERSEPRMRSCVTQWTAARRSGGRVPVRVCRN